MPPKKRSASGAGGAAAVGDEEDETARMMREALGLGKPMSKIKGSRRNLVRKDAKALARDRNDATRTKRRGLAARKRAEREQAAAKWAHENEARLQRAAQEILMEARRKKAEEAAKLAKEQDARELQAMKDARAAALAQHKAADDHRRKIAWKELQWMAHGRYHHMVDRHTRKEKDFPRYLAHDRFTEHRLPEAELAPFPGP